MNNRDFLTGMCAGVALFVVFIAILTVVNPPVSQFGAINKLDEVFPGAKFTVWRDANGGWNVDIDNAYSGSIENVTFTAKYYNWWGNMTVIK